MAAARLEDLAYGGTGGICKAARSWRLTGVKKDELGDGPGNFETSAPTRPPGQTASQDPRQRHEDKPQKGERQASHARTQLQDQILAGGRQETIACIQAVD
jgi:hypothetical protein